MKNLLHNIEILAMVALLMAGIQSCADNGEEANLVEVNFTATLPANAQSRAFGNGKQVNTLVVGVFDNQETEIIYRKSFPINGTSADVQLTLAQEQTYSFIFWAYDSNQNIYDITKLTAIEMNALPNSITFAQAEAADAFFATMKDITITGNCSYPVELIRPLAQVNVGTTGTPMKATFIAKNAPNIFHPFTNTVSGSAAFTWNFNETTTETFSAEGTVYNYLAMGYLFAPTTAMQIEATLTLADKTFNFSLMKIETNQRSNIAGRFTTE